MLRHTPFWYVIQQPLGAFTSGNAWCLTALLFTCQLFMSATLRTALMNVGLECSA